MASANERIQDSRKELVQKIIDNIESGNDLPWRKGWNSHAMRPQNAVTNKNYFGSNRLRLSMVAIEKAYDDPRWATYNQAKANGWQVRKGEKGVLCEKWVFEVTEKVRDENGKIKKDENGKDIEEIVRLDKPIVNYFVVFNAKQIDGIPELKLDKPEHSQTLEIAQNFIQSSECKISEIAQDRAFYRPSTDEIVLPLRDSFKSYDDFLATTLHEMVHSTGHESRLNRDMSGGFGSQKYAREELIAELGAMFTQANLGVQLEGQHFENHSAYLKSWLQALKEDPNELFRAAEKASKASERLYNNYLEYTKEATIEATKDGDILSSEELAQVSESLSRSFENLEVTYHWSEHPIELPNESVLKGEEAYLFLQGLAKADRELNSAREQGEYDYYDKTKLSIKISDPDTSLSLNGVRFDLGDNDLGKYDSIASALKAYREDNINFLKSLSFTEVNKLFSAPTSQGSSAQFKSQDELNQTLDKQLQLGNKTLDRFYEQERNYEQLKDKLIIHVKEDQKADVAQNKQQDLSMQKFKQAVEQYVVSVYSDLPDNTRQSVIEATQKGFLAKTSPEKATELINNMLKDLEQQKQPQGQAKEHPTHKANTMER